MNLQALMFFILTIGSFADHNDSDCWCTSCDPEYTVGTLHDGVCYYVSLHAEPKGNHSCISTDEDEFYRFPSTSNDSVLSSITREIQRRKSASNVGVCFNATHECQLFDVQSMSVSGSCDNVTAIVMQSRQFTTKSIKDEVKNVKLRQTLVKYFYFLGAGIIFLIIGIIIGMVCLSYFYERTYSKLPITNQHP